MAKPDVLPQRPRLPSRLEEEEAPALADDATYGDATLPDVLWAHQPAGGVHLDTVRLVNGNLSGAQLAT